MGGKVDGGERSDGGREKERKEGNEERGIEGWMKVRREVVGGKEWVEGRRKVDRNK